MRHGVIVGTEENCCHGTALKLFQLVSRSKELEHFITASWASPNVNLLRFYLVTSTMFSHLYIQ